MAELLGKPAAAFFPSGIMAQQAALRVWCDRTGSKRVAIPDLSHLLKHEDDGPRRLHGFEFDHLTTGPATATADDLRAALARARRRPGRAAAARRAAACSRRGTTSTALSEAARELGVPLHADGARIWESQPFWDKAARRDRRASSTPSTSRSTRGSRRWPAPRSPAPRTSSTRRARWRRRMGGTLFHLTPYAVSALAGLRSGCRGWGSTPRGRGRWRPS